jgi:site-specific recombinase XerD
MVTLSYHNDFALYLFRAMNIKDYIEQYPDYLRGVRDAADNTVKGYLYDINRYLDYYRSRVDPSLNSFDISAKLMRDYMIYLRQTLKNDDATIERRLHGISAFWLFLHHQHNYPAPVSLKVCGIRIKKKRKPTKPLLPDNYMSILEIIENGLSKIR